MAKQKGTTEKKPRTAEKATKAKKLPTFTGEREVAMVHFNTPEITTAAILSLRKHGGEKYHVTIFDNSADSETSLGLNKARPFKLPKDKAEREKLGDVTVIDNTKGQIIDFDKELDLVKRIRERFSFHEVELRLDANGAFKPDEALYKLELLSQYAQSIEQPIKAGQWAYMAELCRESPIPIALDEELIGVNDRQMKSHLLNVIKPAYIILKPSLHGGMAGCREWIEAARQHGVGSWITSALESNVGLNAIAQFCSDVYGDNITMPQGLGTGQLFTDNIPMPLEIRNNQLWRFADE